MPDAGVAVDGVTIDPGATYRITVNDFLAGGGDRFSSLTAGTNAVTGSIDLDAFVACLGASSPVPVPTDARMLAVG